MPETEKVHEPTKKSAGKSQGLKIGLLVLLLWVLGTVIAVTVAARITPDFSASPTESRDHFTFKEDSRVGILEPLRIAPRTGRSAATPFAQPIRIDGTGDNFVLHWKDEPEVDFGTLPSRLAEGLLGDDSLELFAFATWQPGADDPLESSAEATSDWTVALKFRHPQTLEPFTATDLADLGVPASFPELTPPEEYPIGVIRLLFRSANMGPVRFLDGNGGDAVTSARVTYNLSSLEDKPDQKSIGEWAYFDFALLLWHDKPMTFHIQVLTGEPQYAELSQQLGEQVVFGDRMRLQWLAREDGEFDMRKHGTFQPLPGVDSRLLENIAKPADDPNSIVSYGHLSPFPVEYLDGWETATSAADTSENENENATEATEEVSLLHYRIDSNIAVNLGSERDRDETESETFFRISDEKYTDHLGRIAADGSIAWDFSDETEWEKMEFATCKHTRDPHAPLKLVFLPQLTELTFEIAGAPDLPNPRGIGDLFEQTIPRITLSSTSPGTAESRLLDLICIATQSAIDKTTVWDDEWPASTPVDRTFRNQTPQQLLNWYLKSSRKTFVKQDQSIHMLRINQEEESFWDRVWSYIQSL